MTYARLFLACAVVLSPFAIASDDPNSLAREFIRESVAIESCADREFLGRTDLDHDTCVSRFENAVSRCWETIRPIIPDLRFGQRDFGDDENSEKVLATMYALQKCAQSAILLGDFGDAKSLSDE